MYLSKLCKRLWFFAKSVSNFEINNHGLQRHVQLPCRTCGLTCSIHVTSLNVIFRLVLRCFERQKTAALPSFSSRLASAMKTFTKTEPSFRCKLTWRPTKARAMLRLSDLILSLSILVRFLIFLANSQHRWAAAF